MKILRTPETRFENLPGFAFAPHYCEIDGEGGRLRVHYLDEGPRDAGETVLCLHGEPSWCYLYRKMIPVFVEAGFRVLAPDLIGFGRSDKPAQRSDYTYGRHIGWMREWLEKMDGQNLTLFGQDWGGLIGLRLATAMPDRFARIVVGNTGLPTGAGAGAAFKQWLEFSQNTPEFHIGEIVKMGTAGGFSGEIQAAYDAPFPDDSYKAGARQFPALVPITPDHAQVAENKAAWKILERMTKPVLTAFSDGDPVTRGGEKRFQEKVPGAQGQPHTTIEGAGHFLQEDKGEELAQAIAAFMRSS